MALFLLSYRCNEHRKEIAMKTLGKEVLFLPIGEKNPRNGEGSFARLKDGAILFAYTEYYGESYDDSATARIGACISNDDGESFGAPFVLIEKDSKAENYMSPTLLRLPDGALGIIYLRKSKNEAGKILCMPEFRTSHDEGMSWSEPTSCISRAGYYCGVNDSAIVTQKGRILLAAAAFNAVTGFAVRVEGRDPAYPGQDVYVVASDDVGKTWRELCVIAPPYADTTGLQEPGLYEYENGELLCYMRTGYGFQYECRSLDGGESFNDPRPNFLFTSPDAPMRIKRLGDYTVSVWNPYPYHPLRDKKELWGSPKRTPLLCAVSTDDGRCFDTTDKSASNGALCSFRDCLFLIESDESESYCYPEMIETKDGFLVGYYHSAGTPMCLAATRVKKITWDEVREALSL